MVTIIFGNTALLVMVILFINCLMNVLLFKLYLCKRTSYKNHTLLLYEPFFIVVSIMFFAFIWVFYQDKLRSIRKDNYYQYMLNFYIRIKNRYIFHSDLRNSYTEDIAKCERYIKMRRIQKKIKKK